MVPQWSALDRGPSTSIGAAEVDDERKTSDGLDPDELNAG